MKKIVFILLVLMTFALGPKINSHAAVDCNSNPQFCIVGDGGGGEYPDNYLVDTGLVASVVDYAGYLVGYYGLYVKANDIVVDLNSSALFFRISNTYLSDTQIIQRNPNSGLTNGGSYMLAANITKSQFESSYIYNDVVLLSNYTILVQASQGFLYLNYNTSYQTSRIMYNAYYNSTADAFLLSDYDGMSGSFGRYVYAKRTSSISYSNSHVLGWSLTGYNNSKTVHAYTNYPYYTSLPVNTDISEFTNIIVINR